MRSSKFDKHKSHESKRAYGWAGLVLFCQLFTLQALAWETDNFTCRTRPLADVSSELNAETNRRLQLAMRNSNSVTQEWIDARLRAANGPGSRDFIWKDLRRREAEERNQNESESVAGNSVKPGGDSSPGGGGAPSGIAGVIDGILNPGDPLASVPVSELSKGPRCNREIMIGYLYNAIASSWSDNLETWANGANIPKCRVDVEDSVFSVVTFAESPVARSAGINPVININGTRVGIDKLSHFMTEGYNYLREQKRGGSLTDVLNFGVRQEEGGYGLSTTGVKSFADLAANYKGYAFWQNLFDGQSPYFRCENGSWRQVRTFDWKEFADSSMDESINCNHYRSDEMTAKIDSEIERRWSAAGLTAKTCPASAEECFKLVGSIQPEEALRSVVHPRCLSAGRYEGQIPEALSAPVAEKPSTLLELRTRGQTKTSPRPSSTPPASAQERPIAR